MRSTAPRSRSATLPVFAFAVGGLLIGHALSYLIAVPDPYHRDLVLARTGHGYLPTLAELALVMVLAAAASVLGRVFRGGPDAEPSFGALATRLAALQVVAFAGQEVAERLVAHIPVGELVRDHVLTIGVLTQIVVAIAGAAILRLLVRAAETVVAIAASRSPRPRPALAVPIREIAFALPRCADAGPLAARAPPSA